MAIDPSSLVPRISGGDVGGIINQLLAGRLQKKALGGDEGAQASLAGRDPRRAQAVTSLLEGRQEQAQQGDQREKEILSRVYSGFSDAQDKKGFLAAAAQRLQAEFPEIATGIEDDFQRFDSEQDSVLQEYSAGLSLFSQGGQAAPAGQQQFEALIAKFSPEEQAKARRVQAGLTQRAGISAEDIGDREKAKLAAQLAGKPGIAKETALATDAAKISTESFQQIPGIESNIENLREGVRLIDEGAGTGVLSGFLPSLKETSIKLDNLKNRLGLGVIASVTFGALSEKELKMAFDTALPTKLKGPALKKWLTDRIDAQEKLRDSLEDAAGFLAEPGNTLPMLLKKRRGERKAQKEAKKQAGAQAPAATQAPVNIGRFTREVE